MAPLSLSDIILNLSACRAFLSAMGPERYGEADLVRVMPRALAEEDNGDVCRLELIFGDEGALYDGVESLEVRVLFKVSCCESLFDVSDGNVLGAEDLYVEL